MKAGGIFSFNRAKRLIKLSAYLSLAPLRRFWQNEQNIITDLGGH